MTPAQRQYDIDLVASMQKMAQWIEPRSRKVSVTLQIAADRIQELSASLQVVSEPLSSSAQFTKQPASTPEVKTG